MFTVEQRDRIRDELIARAHADANVVGAALVGSSATGLQDELSDIDLALQLAPDSNEVQIVDQWTQHIASTYGLAHHLDVFAGSTRYRVYLLPESLQIDISFWAHDAFVAIGDRFKLLFGEPPEVKSVSAQDPNRLIGMAWLYALHVRSSIARGEPWHALSLLDDLRDQVLMLACLRHDVNAHQLRGVDALPAGIRASFASARSTSLAGEELRRSLRGHVHLLLQEIRAIDSTLATSLRHPLSEIGDYVS